MIKRLFARLKNKKHGQSFVELMLLIPALALMLAGVVEYGMLLNNYLKVLDGTREGARLASQMVAFDPVTQLPDQRFFVITASKALSTMTPIDLNGNLGDDLIISVFSVSGENVDLRFPNSNGWSLCDNYSLIMGDATSILDIHSFLTTDQYNAFVSNWNACARKFSRVTNADIVSHLVSTSILLQLFSNVKVACHRTIRRSDPSLYLFAHADGLSYAYSNPNSMTGTDHRNVWICSS